MMPPRRRVPRKKVSVLVVDDSTFMRKALKRMLTSDPMITVAGEAKDGREAVEAVKRLRPDVVTLDIKMPVMDGLQALQQIMRECPIPVLMVSSLTSEGGELTLKALEMGAVDIIDKSSCHTFMDIVDIADSLVKKVKVLAGVDMGKVVRTRQPARASRPGKPKLPSAVAEDPNHIIAIGSSTGGPMALETVLSSLPADHPGALLIVQHMPVGFTLPLAERLNRQSRFLVKEAEEDDILLRGRAYIAPGGYHLKLKRQNGRFRVLLTRNPKDSQHRPSVDVMMKSVASVWRGRKMGVLLTGMGTDGVDGMAAIKRAGGATIAQDEKTCVVFGMPRAAHEAGSVDRLLPLNRISSRILEFE